MFQPEHSPGDIIHGRYKIISFISRGGFGETYTVEDTQRASLICLLKYLKPLNSSPTVLRLAEEKFLQEADTLRRLGNHNQIPQLYDYFEENLKFYLVEEYVDGQNLANELRAGFFSETQVIEVLYDVLKVLDYLYQNSVIHRDIKPENLIRRSSDNKIVLVDFGAVKEVGTLVVNAQGQTMLTMAIGTPNFMAPEQAAGRPEFASDIYALGITAFFLLTRRIPTKNHENESILNEVQEPHLAKILENMLRSNYKERYQTAIDVLEDLEPLTLLSQTLNQRYEIKSYLGGGGLSHTYFAKDNQRPYQPDCIIKQLKLKYNNQRLLQEAQTRFAVFLQSLGRLPPHQQIPQISDHFQKNQELYLVHDFIQGEPLSRKITAGNRLSEAEVIILLKDVLEILSFIHQQGVIHGDIKPSNLIRRLSNGKFCLINFAEFKQITNLSMNSQNIIVPPGGTNGYMPPEQYQNRLQHNSDIYALGMTAIQALTGVSADQLQLQTDSENEIWRNQANVSPKLVRILDKMVHFQTGKRYQSAKNVLDDLNAPTWREIIARYWPVSVILSIAVIIYLISKIPPNQAESLAYKGINLLSNGNLDAGISACDNAIKIQPNLAKALSCKGVGLIQKKDFQSGIDILKQAVLINSKDQDSLLNISYAYGQLGKTQEQFNYCFQAQKINNNYHGVSLCFGNAKKASAEEKQKAAEGERARKNTKQAEIKFEQVTKEYLDSITYFNQTIQLACQPGADGDAKTNCAYAWNNKGESLLRESLLPSSPKGQLEKKLGSAIQAFDKAIALNIDAHVPWTNKGKAYLLLKKPEACNAFEQALKIEPKYPEAQNGMQGGKCI